MRWPVKWGAAVVIVGLFAGSAGAQEPEPQEEPAPEPAPEPAAEPGSEAERPRDGALDPDMCMCPCACVGTNVPPATTPPEEAGTDTGPKKNFRWTPYASPGYSPELGGLISGGALFSLSLDPDNPEVPRSSVALALTFTTTGAFLVSSTPAFYLPNDKIRISANLYFKNMDDNYWGVGFEAAENPKTPDETTLYHRLWWQVSPRVVVQVVPDLFVGGLLDFNHTIATQLNPLMQEDPEVVEDGTNNYNGGIGAIVQYDTRDFPQNAFRGYLLEARVTGYGPWLGSKNLYAAIYLDYRHYVTVGKRVGNTFTWNVHSQFNFGETPWSEMPGVGSPYDLRGYYWGRFRAEQGTWGLLEYRYMFPTKNPTRSFSRSGIVAWAGLGFLGRGFLESQLLPNAGVGYRFEVQPRMNLRVDFGWGAEGSFGFYISFLEAF